MAANRFTTLIHHKTNRITLVVVYAFLEWALIFFTLLNSLLSYFILRFADYFCLKRPCLFCSRLDRFFDASGKSPSHRDLLCDDHALEISRERFSYSHSEPVESPPSSFNKFPKDSVDEKITSSGCAPIEPDLGNPTGDETEIHNGLQLLIERSRSISVLEEGNVGSVHSIDYQERSYIREEEETEEKLSEQRKEKKNTVTEIIPQSPGKIEEVEVNSEDEELSCYVSSFDSNKEVTTEKEEENKVDLAMEAKTAQETDVKSAPENLEFYVDNQDCHLIPVEFYKSSEEVGEISDINGDFILDFGAEPGFTAEDGGLFSGEISAFESKPDDVGTNLGSSTDDDVLQMQNDEERDAEVSIGTEIPDHEQIGDVASHQLIPDDDDDNHHHDDDTLEFRTITIETRRSILNVNEERLLETPGSMESLHSLHNAIECPQVVHTVDKLKSELQEERKALKALYEELEEERSASEIAANETMAMISRLQEEKAAMQMEALQYQRMMEEQSEFDQEALQLLSELMVKREKENAELEKEIEVYRKRLEGYEAKEKMGMLRRSRMRDSSVDSYRNNGDSDENNRELQNKKFEGVSDSKYIEDEMENTPVDECLDDYEGERVSILGRLKSLEEKLTALNDEEEVETFENNGNGHFHGRETNGKHRIIKSKRLLPLFDAVDGEMENGNHQENGIDESEKGKKIVTVEEEVDELYERLEVLEADREFLSHCVGSLKKGDKGVHLLHEILQHLRDLRNLTF